MKGRKRSQRKRGRTTTADERGGRGKRKGKDLVMGLKGEEKAEERGLC